MQRYLHDEPHLAVRLIIMELRSACESMLAERGVPFHFNMVPRAIRVPSGIFWDAYNGRLAVTLDDISDWLARLAGRGHPPLGLHTSNTPAGHVVAMLDILLRQKTPHMSSDTTFRA